jgi:hypothetical protein
MRTISTNYCSEVVQAKDRQLYRRINCMRCGVHASNLCRNGNQWERDKAFFSEQGWNFSLTKPMCAKCFNITAASSKAVEAIRAGAARVLMPAEPTKVVESFKPVSFLQTAWDCATDMERDQIIDTVFAWADERTKPSSSPPSKPVRVLEPVTTDDPVLAAWRRWQSES